ncbi:hypothetical protein mRhiFer1_001675 [Rhinolophus ferrumequinum]|uniref:Intraflagellar transport associated protein n=1 Tax=Rhinolophus ferrumequinum TaxID=59479 RepID=A0A7J7W5P2_RHIFE|nr:hypothetical protein mRhiFer1_001675 [Rhinolophus ferrumequinum]
MPELEIMDEDRMIEDVLDRFVNCHEQTYEEFLSTFSHLSKEANVTKRGAFETNSSENIFTSMQFTHENEPNGHCLRKKAIFLLNSSQSSEEEQIVLDEGQKVGSSFQGDLNWGRKVKPSAGLLARAPSSPPTVSAPGPPETFFFPLRPPAFSGSPPRTGLSSLEKLKFVGLLRWEMVALRSAQKPGQRFAAAARRSGAGCKHQCFFLHSFHGPASYLWSKAKIHRERSRQTKGRDSWR